MATINHRLAFERPIYELEARLHKLEAASDSSLAAHEDLRRLKRELTDAKKRIYGNLAPWETVQVARHSDRPMTTDYLDLVFDEFVELHGDKFFGDDRALRTGFAKLDQYKVMVVGHQKGKTTKERIACYHGCAHPEGYRKALAKMKLAATRNPTHKSRLLQTAVQNSPDRPAYSASRKPRNAQVGLTGSATTVCRAGTSTMKNPVSSTVPPHA